MFNLYWTELLVLVVWVLLALGAYWVVRLAVRHGVIDAHRRLPGERRPEQ